MCVDFLLSLDIHLPKLPCNLIFVDRYYKARRHFLQLFLVATILALLNSTYLNSIHKKESEHKHFLKFLGDVSTFLFLSRRKPGLLAVF